MQDPRKFARAQDLLAMNEEIKKAKKVGALMMWGWEFCMCSALSCKLL